MNNNLWLKFFRSIGLIFFVTVSILIVYFINLQQHEAVIKLLVPLGVLISALIASYSIMVSIDNNIEIAERNHKKEENAELNLLKLKTVILKQFLSSYFRDDSQYKEALTQSKISDNCMHSKDMSSELLDKLDNYEQFIDTKIKILLSRKDILEILKDIIQNISIVRAEENFKTETAQKGFTLTVQMEKALIFDLGKLEEKLENLLLYYTNPGKEKKSNAIS